MRGKVQLIQPLVLCIGITPAYAGKSRFPSSTAPYRRDHPRVCGEKAARLTGKEKPRGSPPRVRGKVQQQYDNIQKERITPAYAGKSVRRENSSS